MNLRATSCVSLRQTGFTLVEVLIALVLTAMLASLLVSAVFFASKTRSTVEQDIGAQLKLHTNYSRFEQTLRHCLPELQKEPVLFRGSPLVVECFSTQNLQGTSQAMPINIRWIIQDASDGQSQLKYADESNWDKSIQISTLPIKARFAFWDASGKKRSEWKFEQGQPRLIPTRITIESDDSPQLSGLWSAALRVTPHPELPPPTFLGTVIQ